HRHHGAHRRGSSRTATLQHALVGLVRRTGTSARFGRNLWRDDLLGSAKNARDRRSHRARSAAWRCLANDDQAGTQTGRRRYDPRISGSISSDASTTKFAVRYQCDRSSHFFRHLAGVARRRNPRQLPSGTAHNEGRPHYRPTRTVNAGTVPPDRLASNVPVSNSHIDAQLRSESSLLAPRFLLL